MFKASPQQSDFFSWISNSTGSCLLVAVAGAGKTTTLVEGLKLMSGSIFFGAYNNKIAQEIAAKTSELNIPTLRVSTMHSVGFYNWRRFADKVKLNEKKCVEIFREQHPAGTPESSYEDVVLKLVSYVKQAAIGVDGGMRSVKTEWMRLIEHFDLDTLENDDRVIKLAAAVLSESNKRCTKEIDFDDMIYAPLYFKCRMIKNDWVLVDEAQDTNASRRLLALAVLKPGGRLVAVGDPHQAIYGFTGADSDALKLISTAVRAKELPLTVTYRCPKSVVAYAQQWVSHIQAHESAPEGQVSTLEGTVKLTDVVNPHDAILCRFNAPLVSNVYQFIAKGIPAKIEGREIGEGLKQLARRWKVRSFDQLLDRLSKYEEKEVAKFVKKEMESRVQSVQDKCECLRVLIRRTIEVGFAGDCVKALCDQIESIFADNVNGGHVVLTSIHKSKGREWNRVFWLQAGPSKAKQDWELEQEKNLCYVAATRAKSELFLVPAAAKAKK